MNSYLQKMYYPQLNGTHNMTSTNQYNVFKWQDQYDIQYNYHVNTPNTIYIESLSNCIPVTIIDHINSYNNITTAVITLNGTIKDSNNINHLLSKIKKNIKDKTIIIDFSKAQINSRIIMEINNLPDNIKFSVFNDNSRYDNEKDVNNNPADICYWAMNLDENDFINFCNHTTEGTKKYLLHMRKTTHDFYTLIKSVYPNVNRLKDRQKADIVYKWIMSHIKYNWTPTNNQNDNCDLDDPFIAYEAGKGNCKSRSRLMKLLLNNYYMRVACYLTKGDTLAGTSHEWNEVYDNCKMIYYDIAHGKQGVKYINHINVDNSESKISGHKWKKSQTSSSPTKDYPIYKKVSNL